MFSFLNLSFSSNSAAGAINGDEFEEITCSSPEIDGDAIGFAAETVFVAVATALEAAVGDAETIFRR